MTAKFISSTASNGTDGERILEVWHVPYRDGAPSRQMPLLALADGGIPQKGSLHPFKPDLVCVDVRVESVNNRIAVIAAEFSRQISDSSYTPGQIIDVRFEGSIQEQTSALDINNNTIQNESGTVVWNVKRDVPLATVQIDRVEAALPEAQFLNDFLGRVNSVTWQGYPPRTWLMMGPRSRKIPSERLVVVTYELTYKADNWDHKIEVPVFEYVNKTLSSSIFVLNRDQRVLKASGFKKEAFQIYPSADFNALGISLQVI